MIHRTPLSPTTAVFAAIACLALVSPEAAADTLDDACREVDRTAQTSCVLERSNDREWVLNTGYQIGTGRKSSLETVEARFCDAARRAGVTGRVLREGELPGTLGDGAVMKWDCGPPAVSSAPRKR